MKAEDNARWEYRICLKAFLPTRSIGNGSIPKPYAFP